MAADFKVTFDDNVRVFARDFVDQLGPVATMAMIQSANQVVTQLASTIETTLNKNSKGTLKQNWKPGPLMVSGKLYRIEVVNPLPYARIHETGGVIRPKRVKALAIPNRKYSPIIRNGVPIAPREFDPGRTKLDFFPARRAGKTIGYLVDKGGVGANLQKIAYSLVPSVTIKATGYMSNSVEKALPEIEMVFEDALNAAMVAASKGLL